LVWEKPLDIGGYRNVEYDLLVTDLTANASSRIANIRNTY
jgi:hypothetical protein